MKIVACIKYSLDVSEVKVDPATKELRLAGVPKKVGNIDKNVLEAAASLKESYGGTVHALTFGPAKAKESFREALAMGLWPVCYDNSGPREYISRFCYGSLAQTGDVAGLARVLKTAMQERPWLEGECLSGVVSRVRHDLCASTIWKQLLVHYQDVIEQA